MDDDDALNVSELEDPKHDSVDFEDAVTLRGLIFSLEDCEAKRDNEVAPPPKC